MEIFDRVKLIISETLGSPLTDSYVAKVGGKNIVLKKQGDYSGLDLSNIELEGAHLEGVNLQNAILRNANLTGAHLDGANLEGADLTGTILAGANLTNARIDIQALRLARIDVKPIGIDFDMEPTQEDKS